MRKRFDAWFHARMHGAEKPAARAAPRIDGDPRSRRSAAGVRSGSRGPATPLRIQLVRGRRALFTQRTRADPRRPCRRRIAGALRCGHRGDRMTLLRLLAGVSFSIGITTAAAGQPILSSASSTAHLSNGIEASNGAIRIRVTALTDSVVRVRIARSGTFGEDASWAIPAAARHRSVAVVTTPDGFRTKAIAVHLDPETLQLSVTDLSGRTISADQPAPMRFDGNGFTLRKAMPLTEHYFGMGDKTGVLDRRGYTLTNWNSDTFGYTPSTDPIYKSIPFFIATGGPGGSFGLFLDNTFRSTFDFGHSVADTLRISSVDGPVDYYLITGPDVRDVVRRYADLTGHAPLAPLWSLGYQQSRYSYLTDAEVRAIAT